MGWLIAALGTGLAIAGTLAIYFGAPYIQLEWGYSEVIAGTTALSAGILAVALAAVLFALRDLKRLAREGRAAAAPRTGEWPSVDGTTRSGPAGGAPVVAIPAAAEPVPVKTAEPMPDDEPALFRSAPAVPAHDQAPTVVGRYEANGASYVLFSDGTIEVETETGTRRYASMQDLRADIERQEPA